MADAVTSTAGEGRTLPADPSNSQPSTLASLKSQQRSNSSDASLSEDVDALSNALVGQVEWYLGRSNLSSDYFLMQQMREDFFVQLSVLANFPKMKRMLAGRDLAFLASAIRERSSELELDGSGTSVRPLFALNEKRRSVLMLRDVPASLRVEDINALFISHNQQPESIRPDVGDTWFITFDTPDGAKAALEHIKDATLNGAPIKARVKLETIARTLAAAAPTGPPPGVMPMGMPTLMTSQQQQQHMAAMMASGAPPPGAYLPYGFVPAPNAFRPGPPPPGAFYASPPPHFAAQISAMVPPAGVPNSQPQPAAQAGVPGGAVVGMNAVAQGGLVPGMVGFGVPGAPQHGRAMGAPHGRDGGSAGGSGVASRHSSGGGAVAQAGGNHRGASNRTRSAQASTGGMQPRSGSYPPASGDNAHLAQGGVNSAPQQQTHQGAGPAADMNARGTSGRRNSGTQAGTANGGAYNTGGSGSSGPQGAGLQKKKKGSTKKEGSGEGGGEHGAQRKKNATNASGAATHDNTGFAKKEMNLLTESFPPLSGAADAPGDGIGANGLEGVNQRADVTTVLDTAWKSPIPAATHAMPAPKPANSAHAVKAAVSRGASAEGSDLPSGTPASLCEGSAKTAVSQAESKGEDVPGSATASVPNGAADALPDGLKSEKKAEQITGAENGGAKSYAAILRAAKKPDAPSNGQVTPASSPTATGGASAAAPDRSDSGSVVKKPSSPAASKSASSSDTASATKKDAADASAEQVALGVRKLSEDLASVAATPPRPVNVWANKPKSVLEKPTAPVVPVQNSSTGAGSSGPGTAADLVARRKFTGSGKGGGGVAIKGDVAPSSGVEKFATEAPSAKAMDENVA